MIQAIKCKGNDGKLLFVWNPSDDTISIIRKDVYYKVKLDVQGKKATYCIVDEHPKKNIKK